MIMYIPSSFSRIFSLSRLVFSYVFYTHGSDLPLGPCSAILSAISSLFVPSAVAAPSLTSTDWRHRPRGAAETDHGSAAPHRVLHAGRPQRLGGHLQQVEPRHPTARAQQGQAGRPAALGDAVQERWEASRLAPDLGA